MNIRRLIIIVGAIVGILFVLFNLESQHKETVDLATIKQNGINIMDYGVRGDGKTDDTERFQQAIDDAVNSDQYLIVPANTYLVSPLKFRDNTSADWWCLGIPSNAKIYFETGAVLKLVDDAPEWTRVLVISEVANVAIYGHVQIDGNAHTVTNGNEHMHGIFIYDSKDIYIESAHSYNCYGDNLFIGGTEENYSEHITINFFKGVTAGRKNLVIHYVDQLYIRRAILDNSKGGVGNNWLGENSLDLEPDNFKGKKSFTQRIDSISTYGTGNDFTVGTEKELAQKWRLEIGQFNVVLMDETKEGLLSYAVTIKIEKLFIKSSRNNQDIGIRILYGAIWEIGELYFEGGSGYALSAREADGEKPILKLGKVLVSRPLGEGFELWGADAKIDVFEVNSTKGKALDILSTSVQNILIQKFIIKDSGDEEIISISDYGYEPKVEIEELLVSDARQSKAKSIFYLNTEAAVNGLKVNNIQNLDRVIQFSFGPTVNNQ